VVTRPAMPTEPRVSVVRVMVFSSWAVVLSRRTLAAPGEQAMRPR
jgi:hypothetical protein